jgi:hypothetical protein
MSRNALVHTSLATNPATHKGNCDGRIFECHILGEGQLDFWLLTQHGG